MIILRKRIINFPELIRHLAVDVKAITLMQIGIPMPIHSEDRKILEQVILPYFAGDDKFFRILFVGTEKYTWQYKKIFAKKEYWTIEPRLWSAIYGARRHIVGYLDDIDRYFEKNSLDLIICNGVLGYGLDDPREIESSFKKCYLCLRNGGILVLGWNNRKEWLFLPLEKYESLRRFQPLIFPPLGTCKYQTGTENNHTFSFYYKPNIHNKLDLK
jgi:SAM-dependent methyltransferase